MDACRDTSNMSMLLGESFIFGILTGLSSGELPVEPGEQDKGAVAVDGMQSDGGEGALTPVDSALLSQRLYNEAVAFAEESRFYDASLYIIRAYRLLDQEQMYGDAGIFMMKYAIKYHRRAYAEMNDEELLASIQAPLEQFLENYSGGENSELHLLERKLNLIREKRLDVADGYMRQKKYADAVRVASDCYLMMRPAARGADVGERAVLQLALAHRNAWYLDGRSSHFEDALELVEDHAREAEGGLSKRVRREQRTLLRGKALLKVRDPDGEAEDDVGGGVLTGQDRSFLIASGASVAGGISLGVGAAVLGGAAFVRDGNVPVITMRPGFTGPGIALSAVGAAVSGLAMHSMIDAGYVSPRARKIVAFSSTAVGAVSALLGAVLLVRGNFGSESRDDLRLQSAGLGMLLVSGAPLGAGISALISRPTQGPLSSWAQRRARSLRQL